MINFRQANKKDIDSILLMVSRIIKCPGTAWDEYYPTRPFFEESLGFSGLYVAEENEKIIGTLGVQPAEGIFVELPCWSRADNPAEGCRLGIDPDYQGRHLAIPFMDFCLSRCI